MVEAAVLDVNGSVQFKGDRGKVSKVVTDNVADCFESDEIRECRAVTIDTVVKDEKVGFIKMDIEGAEYGALHGAAETIKRDKPFLAICVYHKPGDVLAIMDYCHKLVPEYKFWLRHYGVSWTETVLYASVKSI